jgi:transposase InsO family protein
MSDDRKKPTVHERWAHLRFSVVGALLAAPPRRGELQGQLELLAQKSWKHPVTGEPTSFGVSTIERWYHQARKAPLDPVGVLRRKVRKDEGQQDIPEALKDALRAQHAAHPSWSYQLHYDNLKALATAKPELGKPPSYSTVRRWMKSVGLRRGRRPASGATPGAQQAQARLEAREVRSYENPYVNGLWHLDFHRAKRVRVLTLAGAWQAPLALGVLDDHSRVCCHAQWYLAAGESAEDLVHGFCQACQKRALPRSAMSDQGAAMKSAEFRQGLTRLGIVQEMTLPHSPYQNGKQENFWAQLEGRLAAMLENVPDLTLAALNEATQAWVELEYNRKHHSELGEAPLQRYLRGKDVGRPCPSSEELRLAFCTEEVRTQRRSDGTLTVDGRRFEVPSRFRHLERVTVRYASWDLGRMYLVDERTGTVLDRLYPLDRARNADGQRRALEPVAALPAAYAGPPAPAVPPLLSKLMSDYAALGLPPAYLPKGDKRNEP